MLIHAHRLGYQKSNWQNWNLLERILYLHLQSKKNVQWGVLQFVLFVVIGRYFWYGIRAQGYRYHPRRMEY